MTDSNRVRAGNSRFLCRKRELRKPSFGAVVLIGKRIRPPERIRRGDLWRRGGVPAQQPQVFNAYKLQCVNVIAYRVPQRNYSRIVLNGNVQLDRAALEAGGAA